MNKSFQVEVVGKQFTQKSRESFRKHFLDLDDGKYKIALESMNTSFTPSRYKYYFDYVMFVILHQASDHLKILNREGEFVDVETTAEVHQIIKAIFNPITFVDLTTGVTGTIGKSTKGLSDRQFIGEFTEKVIAHYSSEPFFCDLSLTYDDWKFFHQSGQWHKVKQLIQAGEEISLKNINFE